MDQMHALFWSPRWPSQQFQHLNLTPEDFVLFLWRVFKSKHFGFFFSVWNGKCLVLQQAYRVALWDKCAWIAACWIWGYLDCSLSPLAAGCRAVGISKWCECKRWLCREVLIVVHCCSEAVLSTWKPGETGAVATKQVYPLFLIFPWHQKSG